MKNANLGSSRRKFLQNIASVSFTSAAAPLIASLGNVSNASAQTPDDYKAVVFVYLGGGNDHLNMVVPYDTSSFTKYQQSHGALARERSTLLPITPTTSQSGKEAAFNANMPGIKALFDSQRLAVVASVGPLIAPVTKGTFGSPTVPLPPQLFSHLDQSIFWSTSQSNGGQQGWGGRFGDELASGNRTPALTTISVSGYTKLLIGQQTSFFTASEYGAPGSFFEAGSGLEAAVTGSASRTNLLERAYAQVHESLRDNGAALSDAILPANVFPTAPGGGRNGLAQQLQTVARIIGARTALGAKRQVFYVSMGGFDTHSNQNDTHDKLMTALNDALVYFDGCMGILNTRNQVTLATYSEFGRTLTSNGDGTDHGWGSHHLVLGGAVRGKNIYGKLPTIDINGPDFLAEGNQIPTTSIEQYGATLAKWIGVPDTPSGSTTGIGEIFPNLGNFNQRDLGFLKT
jgi:uncharacterized protein (DUF1501 family)